MPMPSILDNQKITGLAEVSHNLQGLLHQREVRLCIGYEPGFRCIAILNLEQFCKIVKLVLNAHRVFLPS